MHGEGAGRQKDRDASREKGEVDDGGEKNGRKAGWATYPSGVSKYGLEGGRREGGQMPCARGPSRPSW